MQIQPFSRRDRFAFVVAQITQARFDQLPAPPAALPTAQDAPR